MAASHTVSIPLNKPWTNTHIRPKIVLSKHEQWVDGAQCWVDHSTGTAYRLGGRRLDQLYPGALPPTTDFFWKFHADGAGGGTWDSLLEGPTFSAMPYTAFTSTTGYQIGGYIEKEDHPSPILGVSSKMFEYDFGSKAWNQGPSAPFSVPNMTGLTNGKAIFVPSYGLKGLIVLVGGTEMNDEYISPALSRTNHLNEVTFLDIATQKWHRQKTIGHKFGSVRECLCVVRKDSLNGNFDM